VPCITSIIVKTPGRMYFSMTMIGLRSLRSFASAYREHGCTMKKVADYLGLLERRGCELAAGVASRKNRVYCPLPVEDYFQTVRDELLHLSPAPGVVDNSRTI